MTRYLVGHCQCSYCFEPKQKQFAHDLIPKECYCRVACRRPGRGYSHHGGSLGEEVHKKRWHLDRLWPTKRTNLNACTVHPFFQAHGVTTSIKLTRLLSAANFKVPRMLLSPRSPADLRRRFCSPAASPEVWSASCPGAWCGPNRIPVASIAKLSKVKVKQMVTVEGQGHLI